MKRVIDLSRHNGTVDFSKVKAIGINDVILQLGWIGNYNNHTIDTKFIENYNNAKANGFNIGIYVYSYVKSIEGIRNACNWIFKNLSDKNINLPIFLDLEDESISNLGKENLTNQALEFCKLIEERGYKAGVYANKYWFTTKIDHNKLLNYKIWWAEYNEKDKPTNNLKIDLWQYTSKAKIQGINGNVDVSKCMCECSENNNKNGDDVEVKIYKNGSTSEPIYSDTNLKNKIGSLNPYEQCECLGIFENRAIVRYKVDNANNYKIGFAKWLGGVQ